MRKEKRGRKRSKSARGSTNQRNGETNLNKKALTSKIKR